MHSLPTYFVIVWGTIKGVCARLGRLEHRNTYAFARHWGMDVERIHIEGMPCQSLHVKLHGNDFTGFDSYRTPVKITERDGRSSRENVSLHADHVRSLWNGGDKDSTKT